jgi:hypothetical protein
MSVRSDALSLRPALALALVGACGPEPGGDDGPPASDTAWLIDSFAYGCADPITQCMAAHYYEFVFEPDGTLQTYDIVCGVREAAQVEREGRWRPTDEYGVAEILPREGEESFKATVQSIEFGLVQRSDDCGTVDLDFDADGIYDALIYRGTFHYVASACEAKAVYLGDPPGCPDSAPTN